MAELPLGGSPAMPVWGSYQPDFRIDRTGKVNSVAASFISSPPSID